MYWSFSVVIFVVVQVGLASLVFVVQAFRRGKSVTRTGWPDVESECY